jgi:uncharacterized RDD family membrane protein YckC
VSDTPDPAPSLALARAKATALTADRMVSAEPLSVAPQFIGARLASPQRRALAMALDLLAIALLTGVGGLWLVAGMAVLGVQLASKRGGVPRSRARWWGWAAAALVLWLGLGELQERWRLYNDPASITAARPHAAAADDDDDGVADAARSTASAASAANPASAAEARTEPRVAKLEAALAKAQRRLAGENRGLRERLVSWLDDIGAGLGWGIVYFSLLPAWWRGQTLGKKLMRLRVVELSGQPITVMRSLKRYGGYVAGLATGGIGLLQLLWDPNRQGLHDKAAHTVVLDERPLNPA